MPADSMQLECIVLRVVGMSFRLCLACLIIIHFVADDPISNSLALVLVHDHLSGHPDTPAQSSLTRRLRQAQEDLAFLPLARAGLPLLSENFQLLMTS